jgi:hypothetical protein
MCVIPDNHKFAALSLHGTGATFAMPDQVAASSNLLVSTSLPFEVTPWWLEQLGILTSEELKDSDLYMLAIAPSQSLSILDHENRILEDQCRNFFYGLLMAVPFSTDLSPHLLTGSVESGKATFRQIGRFERPCYIYGTPAPDLTSEHITRAAFLGQEIDSIVKRSMYGRTIWAFNCFINSVTAGHVYERMRNSIRTIEAFVLPVPGRTEKQFKSRTELFIGPSQHFLIGSLYSIRSNIEHLHDPLTSLPGISKQEKQIQLFRAAYMAECIARYCVQTFLTRQQLWPHFQDDHSIEAFWQLASAERTRLWGDILDISSVEQTFNPVLAAAGAE